ncbi:uncharacterized protein FFE2_15426 [Fusarium fujikuroi]
MAFSN